MKNMLHALRLYVSPVFVRENYSLLTGIVWLCVAYFIAFTDHEATHWQDGLFKLPSSLSTWWWLGLQGLITSVSVHYWRQVRSPLARMTPGMITAEYRAVHFVLVFVTVVMAIPIWHLGAPLLNILALEALSLCMVVNSDMTTPKALRSGPIRWLRMVLMVGMFFVFLFPQAQERVLSAPWYVGAALLMVGVTLTLIELQHIPAPVQGHVPGAAQVGQSGKIKVRLGARKIGQMMQAMKEPGQNKRASPPINTGFHAPAVEPQTVSVAVQDQTLSDVENWGASFPSQNTRGSRQFTRIMMWQFPWLRKPPVPNTMITPGPAGFLVTSIALVSVFFCINFVVETVHAGHWPEWAAIRKSMITVAQMICMISANGLTTWILMRADWPFLLNLAGYGTRADFAYALYATHAKRAVQSAALAALLCAPLGIEMAGLAWSRLPITMLALFVLIVGSSYLPSVGLLLTPRKTRPAIIHVLNMLGSFVYVQMGFALLLSEHSVPVWLWGILLASVPFSLVMAWLGPRALARVDWPIEPLMPS